jgi:AraC-like DNA-binding protein
VPTALRPWVRDIHGFTERTSAPLCRTELPLPLVVVIIELGPPLLFLAGTGTGGPERHAGGFAAGVGDAVATMEHQGFQAGVQVNLTPLGAQRWFGVPMSEIACRTVSLRDVLPGDQRFLAEQLAEIDGWDRRFDLVERLIARRVLDSEPQAEVVRWALGRLEEAGGNVDLGRLAHEMGYSTRQVTRLFRKYVGIRPKLFGRLVRFDRLAQRLREGPATSWAELAADGGFCDQSHLVREVRHFSGRPPREAIDLITAGWSGDEHAGAEMSVLSKTGAPGPG